LGQLCSSDSKADHLALQTHIQNLQCFEFRYLLLLPITSPDPISKLLSTIFEHLKPKTRNGSEGTAGVNVKLLHGCTHTTQQTKCGPTGRLSGPQCYRKRCWHQKRRRLIKITRNNWKQKTEQSRFPVVSRDFDKPAAFLVPAAFLAALGPHPEPKSNR
jgi:hypothetical protein